MSTYFVAGGAGFIGHHLVGDLLGDGRVRVVVFDNFSSGRDWHLEPWKNDPRLRVVRGDLKDGELLLRSMEGADVVYHFASNPDIAKAMTQPDIDFWEGTFLTNQVLEAMRKTGVERLLYASGSGVYGDIGTLPAREDHGPLLPISTYGASKLAGEAMIGSYCHMFGIRAAAFRFANVIGPHQTHGVIYDFIRRLLQDPAGLDILGDGSQSKSYLFVGDVISAMRLVERSLEGFNAYNVATEDYITVWEIADATVRTMGLRDVVYRFSGGDRGWKGDVPIVRFDSSKIRAKGWKNASSTREAVERTIRSILEDGRHDRFGWGVPAGRQGGAA